MSDTIIIQPVVNELTVTEEVNDVIVSSVGVQGPAGATGATGATGPQGPSGVIAVTAPITNSGTSTSATIGIDTTNFAFLNTANTFTTTQTITPSSISAKSLVLSSATGTVNMQDWVANGGTSYVDSAGRAIFRAIGTNYTSPGPQNTMIFANSLSATVIGLVVKGAASQSADIQQWQNSAGTTLVTIGATGNTWLKAGARVSGNYGGTQTLLIQNDQNIIGVTVKANTTQTANLTEWQNSGGTILAKIAASGNIVAGNMAIAASSVSTIHISNGTIPSANPVGGGVLYVESGALKYRGSSGTITTLGVA